MEPENAGRFAAVVRTLARKPVKSNRVEKGAQTWPMRSDYLLAGILAGLLLSLIAPAFAQSDARRHVFDIDRAPIVYALQKFHMQTRLSVGYLPTSSEEEDIRVGPLKGQYTVEEALTQLLTPVGFSFGWTDPNMIEVISPGASPQGTGDSEQENSIPRSRRFTREIERVIVTAGRIRDVEERASAVKTFDRQRIERTGASTVADLLKYISQQPYAHAEGFRTSGAQFAELRGLGPDMTLVLINGRRTLPSAGNITSNAFDLNSIPVTAVDRVEILLDSASAQYGTDAIGGVVNIVLRRDIPHPTIDLHYGTADGGAEQRRASLSAGYRRSNANGMVVVDYFDVSALLGVERNRWRDQDFRRFSGADERSINSAPGNIMSFTSANLPGLPAQFAAVPGRSQAASVTTADFIATAGQRNSESLLQYWSLVPEVTRLSALALGELELIPRLVVSGEVLYVGRRTGFQFSPPVLAGLLVPATNAFNPFGVPVITNALLSRIEPQQQNVESTLTRAAAGLRGKWSTWDWEFSVLRNDEEASVWVDHAVDFKRVMAALAQSDANQALNIFQDGGGGSAELLASLLADRKSDRLASKGTQVTGFARGAIPLGLPAGPMTVIAGGEWRNEVAEFDALRGSFDRTISAAFAELKIPLVSAAMRLPSMDSLTLTISGRHDDYSDFGTSFNPQYGLIWQLSRDLTVRGSYGRTFRPPSLYELFMPKMSTPIQITDPSRDGELATFTMTIGGSRDLAPTHGESLTAGFVFEPSALEGIQISASYWRVAMDDRAVPLFPPELLAHEAAFADRVFRADPTPADVAAGRRGALRSVDGSRVNSGWLETDGIDFSATYDFNGSLGQFTTSLSATWIDRFDVMDLPSMPAVERIGVANFAGTIAKWRAVAEFGWQRGTAGASMSARYVPAYDDAIGGFRTGRRIPSQAIFDVQASIGLDELGAGESMWRGLAFTAGALNLFDDHAPFAQVSASGFDMSQGDLKGRFIYLRLRKTF